MSEPTPERDTTGALLLLVTAVLILVAVYAIPRLPGRDASSAFAKTHHLSNADRENVRVLLKTKNESGQLSLLESPLAHGQPLVVEYDGRAYPFWWLVAIRDGAEVAPLMSPREKLGARTKPGGGTLEVRGLIASDTALLAYFSPLPLDIGKLRKAVKAVGSEEPARIAAEIQLPGKAVLRVIPR